MGEEGTCFHLEMEKKKNTHTLNHFLSEIDMNNKGSLVFSR